MNEIFLSYRRADEKGTTGRLFDHLVQAFGKEAIFYDVDKIPHGADFREFIDRTIRSCTAVLVVIGPLWLDMRDDSGRRLDQVNDPVRIEVETALRWRKAIIPVLIDDARMPDAGGLPPTIAQLASQNAAPIHNNQYFEQDINALINDIARLGVARRSGGFIANPPSAGLPTLSRRQTAAILGIPLLFVALGLVAVLGVGYLGYMLINGALKNFPGGTNNPSSGIFDVSAKSSVDTLQCAETGGHPPAFTVTLTNSGTGKYQYAAQINDKDPANVTWATVGSDGTGTLDAGKSATFTVTPAPSLCGDMTSRGQHLVDLGVTARLTPVGGGDAFNEDVHIGVFA